jgi:peptide/nickel transport system permease protein
MGQTSENKFRTVLQLLTTGSTREASIVLAGILKQDPGNERAWHMLSYALTDRHQQIYALQRTLAINPGNRAARNRLKRLSDGAVDAARQASLSRDASSSREPAPAGRNPSPELSGGASARLLARQALAVSTPVSSGLARSPAGWPSAGLAQAGAHPARILPFPGLHRMPTVEYSRGQLLRIRARLSWRRFKENWAVFSESRLAVLGLVIIVLFALMAVAHPILMNTVWPRPIYDPVTGFDMAVAPHPTAPGPGHLLGTDTLGRDVLSMLLAATTPTFIVGLTAALTTAFVGTLLSVMAAYFRGTTDTVITNLADVFLLFPAPIIMVIIGARFRDLGPVPLGLIYGLVTGAGATALVMRAHGLHVVSKPYMEAAHVAGGGAAHVIIRHMLPAMLPLAALQMMIAVSGAVVADGFISFFGLTRSVSNWGTIIYDAFVYGQVRSTGVGMWHMLLPAAICFSLFATGFYLVSRGLHRVAAPTIREELDRR